MRLRAVVVSVSFAGLLVAFAAPARADDYLGNLRRARAGRERAQQVFRRPAAWRQLDQDVEDIRAVLSALAPGPEGVAAAPGAALTTEVQEALRRLRLRHVPGSGAPGKPAVDGLDAPLPGTVGALPAALDLARLREEAESRAALAADVSADVAVVESRAYSLSLAELNAMGFTLRQAYGQPADPHGATLTYTNDRAADVEGFEAQFCLKWQPEPSAGFLGPRWQLGPQLAIEGHLTTSSPGDENFWRFYAGLSANLDAGETWGGQRALWDPGFPVDRTARFLYADLLGVYEWSQDRSIEKLTAKLNLVPVVGDLALGVRRGHETITREDGSPFGRILDGLLDGCCASPRNAVSGQWDLRAAVDVGQVVKAGDGSEHEGALVRAEATVSGRLYLDWIGRDVLKRGTDSTLYPFFDASYSCWWTLSQGDDAFHDQWAFTFKLPFNSLVSLDASYVVGDEAPTFDRVQVFQVSVSFGF